MTQLLDEAVDALERRVFFDTLDAGYFKLRQDPVAWSEIAAERAIEQQSLGDASS